MRVGQLVRRRDADGIVVSLVSRAWPGCVQVEWSDGRREWVTRAAFRVHVPAGHSRVGV